LFFTLFYAVLRSIDDNNLNHSYSHRQFGVKVRLKKCMSAKAPPLSSLPFLLQLSSSHVPSLPTVGVFGGITPDIFLYFTIIVGEL